MIHYKMCWQIRALPWILQEGVFSENDFHAKCEIFLADLANNNYLMLCIGSRGIY